MEQRLILYLVAKIDYNDNDLTYYSIDLNEAAKTLLITTHSAKTQIEKTIDTLQTRLIKIRNEQDKKWIKVGWIIKSEYYDDGRIRVKIDDDLKPYLLALKREYTKYKLSNIIQLRSGYSIRIYEWLKQYENLQERTLTIKEIRKILDLPKQSYKSYKDLKRKVILTAQREINNTTDINFTYKEIIDKQKTRGRPKITAIRFTITRKDNKLNLNINPLYSEMTEYGIDKEEIEKIYEQQWNYVIEEKRQEDIPFEQYIREKIYYTKIMNEQGKVKSSVSGLLLKAIRENYNTGSIKEERTQQDTGTKQQEILATVKKIERQRDKEIQIICNNILKDNEDLINELIKETTENPLYYKDNKTPQQNYDNSIFFRSEINQLIQKRYPLLFADTINKYDKKITTAKKVR